MSLYVLVCMYQFVCMDGYIHTYVYIYIYIYPAVGLYVFVCMYMYGPLDFRTNMSEKRTLCLLNVTFFLEGVCSFVWGDTRLGTPSHQYWGFGDTECFNIHTYKHTNIHVNWSIRNVLRLKSNHFLYVKQNCLDKTHGNNTYKKINTFRKGYFLWHTIPRNYGKYNANS